MGEFNTRKLLQFQTYKDCLDVKICTKDGKHIRQNYLGNLTIRSDVPIRIGIDQSSSQTGMAVKKSTGELICLLDFVNVSQLPYTLFRSMLGLKIEQLFSCVEVEMCILEKMWGGSQRSFEMLSDLAQFIEKYKYIIESWRKAEIAEILPNVWRSSYLADPQYKGMFTKDKVKIAAMEEGIRRYPQLQEYGEVYKEYGHINDSFDALGILEGYEDKTFSKDGSMRKVANTITATNHKFSYCARHMLKADYKSLPLPEQCPSRTIVDYEYNPDYSVQENVRRVTSVTNKIARMLVTDDVAKIQLMWHYGGLIPRDNTVILYGWRDNVSQKLDTY